MKVRKRKAAESRGDDASDVMAEALVEKKARIFSMQNFQERFKANPIEVLTGFLSACEDGSVTVVKEFLASGGQPQDILKLLHSSSVKGIEKEALVFPVFSVLKHLLLCYMRVERQHQQLLETTCWQLLKVHVLTVRQALLATNEEETCKTTLSMLAAVVTINPNLAKEVLSHIHNTRMLVRSLPQQKSPKSPSTIRTCFIHFLMAFLITEDSSVIELLCAKKGLLECVFPDLATDLVDTVLLVLTTVRYKLVENKQVKMSSKIAFFDTAMLQSLLKLYKWVGPKGWDNRGPASKQINVEVDKTSQLIVTHAVHELLLALCSLFERALTFRSTKEAASSKQRKFGRTILQEFKEPWSNKFHWELVLKMLVACPDLVKGFVSSIESFLEPRNSPQWQRTVRFYRQLLESLNPEVCVLSHSVTVGAIVSLTAPASILMFVEGESLSHARLWIRHELALLLSAMLHATERFCTFIETRQLLDMKEHSSLRANIISHLLKYLPSGSVLTQAWCKSVENVREDEEANVVSPPTIQEHLSVLLDLLDAYGKCCPMVLNCTLLKPHQLLADLQALSADSSMIIKALSVLFSLDHTGFSPEKEVFKSAVALLLGLVDDPDSSTVQQLLLALLHQTDLFIADKFELLTWLHCYLEVQQEARSVVTRLLTDALVLVSTNPLPFADMLSAAMQMAKQDTYYQHEHYDLDHILEELVGTGSVSKDMSVALHYATLSPLLPGFLQLAAESYSKDSGVQDFASRVVIHLLHGQVSADIMWYLLNRWPSLILPATRKYVEGWLPSSSPAPLRKPFLTRSLERKLSQLILQPDKLPIEEVFGKLLTNASDKLETPLSVDVFGEFLVRDSFHVFLLLKLLLFHFTQLVARNCVTKQSCEIYQQSVLCLLRVLRTLSVVQTKNCIRCEDKLVENYFKCLFMHPVLLSSFTTFAMVNKNRRIIADLVTGVIPAAGDVISQDVLTPLRQKLVRLIKVWLESCHEGSSAKCSKKVFLMLQLFKLDLQEMVELAELAVTLSIELLVRHVDSNARLSRIGLMLSFLLQNICQQNYSDTLKYSVVLQRIVENVARHLMSLQGKNVVNISKLEKGFLLLIEKYPHHVVHLPPGFLECLVKNQQHSPCILKMCVFMIRQSEDLAHKFVRLAIEHSFVMEDATFVFQVLSAVLSHGTDVIDKSLLQWIFERHGNIVHQASLQQRDILAWLKLSIDVVILLVDTFMDVDMCRRLCRQVLTKGTVSGKPHLQLLQCLFTRAGWEGALVNLLLGAAAGGEQNGKMWWLNQLCHSLCHNVVTAGPHSIATVRAGGYWWRFATWALTLKLEHNSLVLDVLRDLCDALYEDGSDHPQTVELFNKLMTNPQFLQIMYNKTGHAKELLLELMLVLTRKGPSVMITSHGAMLLGSYGATLSTTDQLILKLLHQYECGGVSLQKWRPFLWGQAAITHYSVTTQLSASLLQQPSVTQILDLLTPAMVDNTVSNFPITRQLDAGTQLHDHCPWVYDPAFMLPLLSHLLSPENPVTVTQVHQSGALALCIAALSSDHHTVRQAACHVIARFYFHLEASRQRKEKSLWLQVVNALRDGMPSGPEVAKLPSVATVYLAQATRHISDPKNPLFEPLHNYICLWPAFNPYTMPDFLRLFHSADVSYRHHQQFILEVLHAGIRQEVDFNLVHKVVIYKMIMTFYSSVLADENSKVLILKVIQSSVKVPTAASLLVSSYALLSWLDSVVRQLQHTQSLLVNAALHVLCSLWASLGTQPGHAVVVHVLKLLLSILPKLHLELPVKVLWNYLEALGGAAAAIHLPGAVTQDDVNAVLHLCKGNLGSVDEYEYLVLFRQKFSLDSFHKLKSANVRRTHLLLSSFLQTWLENTSKSE